ncbi:hypothetical protein [Proteus columbae]|uniref:hypothetical protein n=1 Tax=Proteus columbae TaxID=1987580 RepID=UPI002889940E|nr:hypothetical protein [Proteus columbae]
MEMLIYSGGGGCIIGAIGGLLWKLSKRNLEIEKRITQLEQADILLNQKVESIQESQNQISNKVERIETTLHQIDKNVITTTAMVQSLLDIIKK